MLPLLFTKHLKIYRVRIIIIYKSDWFHIHIPIPIKTEKERATHTTLFVLFLFIAIIIETCISAADSYR